MLACYLILHCMLHCRVEHFDMKFLPLENWLVLFMEIMKTKQTTLLSAATWWGSFNTHQRVNCTKCTKSILICAHKQQQKKAYFVLLNLHQRTFLTINEQKQNTWCFCVQRSAKLNLLLSHRSVTVVDFYFLRMYFKKCCSVCFKLIVKPVTLKFWWKKKV